MKKLVLFFILFFAFSAFGSAQVGAAPSAQSGGSITAAPKSMLWNIERSQKKLVRKLDLDAEQLRKFDAINDRYVTRVAAAHENKSVKKSERKAQIRQIRKERDAEQLSVLDARQLAAWNKVKHIKSPN